MNRILTRKAWAAIKAIVPMPNLYPLDNSLYGLDRGGSIRLRAPKAESRRDRRRIFCHNNRMTLLHLLGRVSTARYESAHRDSEACIARNPINPCPKCKTSDAT